MSSVSVALSTSYQAESSYVVLTIGEVRLSALTSKPNTTSVSVFNSGNLHEISIGDLRDSRVRAVRPIPILLTDRGDYILAEFVDAGVAVSDDTASAAIEWMRATIAKLYVRYDMERGRLGPFAAKQLEVLEKYVVQV